MKTKSQTSVTANLITSSQAAELLGVSEQCLRNWRHLGTRGPKFVKLGGRSVRYRQSDIEAWVEANTRTPVSVN